MLKRIATLLFTAMIICAPSAIGAKPKNQDLLPRQYAGSMMPYDFSRCDATVAWPDSLQPVFLSYTARHGARFMTSPKKIELISKALHEAEKKGQLSRKGKDFLKFMREISAKSDGHWGLLSSVGIAEEERLGSDMAKMLPKLFKRGEGVAESTYVPRVVMTMYQFMHALEIPNQKLEMTAASGHRFDSLLRCFAKDKAYAEYRDHGVWQNDYDAFVQRHVSSDPAARLFTNDYPAERPELRALTMSMYGLIQSLEASGLSDATTEFMTSEEYYGCWEASNMLHYLRNNINPLTQVAGKATSPLLEAIMNDADNALKDGKMKMHGYFGHAETLLPLFSLMNIPGCFVMTDDYETLSKVWKVQDITPLGANLAVVLLKGKSGEIYASVRHNGRNVSPIPGQPEIVKWSALKSYWRSRITEYN